MFDTEIAIAQEYDVVGNLDLFDTILAFDCHVCGEDAACAQ